jgi:hypothetical protein
MCPDSCKDRSASVLFNSANQFDTIFAGCSSSGSIFRSTNSALSWQIVLHRTPLDFGRNINSFAQDPLYPNIIWAGGSSGSLSRDINLFFTTDGGEHWEKVFTKPTIVDNGVGNICITAYPHVMYLGMRGFVIRSSADSGTWSICLSKPENSLYVTADPWNEKHIIAGGVLTFVESFDSGITWDPLSFPDSSNIVWGMAWDNETDNLYAINTNGVYVLIHNPSVWNEKFPFIFYQNYPNPFNEKTTFIFEILGANFSEDALPLQLKIFDMLGREIETIINGPKPAGRYTINWNANSFPSGIYFCRLSAGNFTQTRKLLFIR